MPIDAASASVLSQIAALETGTNRCPSGPFIAGLPAADQEGIAQAIAAGYTMTAIAKFVVSRGFRFAPQSVVRHLSGRCSCPKAT